MITAEKNVSLRKLVHGREGLSILMLNIEPMDSVTLLRKARGKLKKLGLANGPSPLSRQSFELCQREQGVRSIFYMYTAGNRLVNILAVAKQEGGIDGSIGIGTLSGYICTARSLTSSGASLYVKLDGPNKHHLYQLDRLNAFFRNNYGIAEYTILI